MRERVGLAVAGLAVTAYAIGFNREYPITEWFLFPVLGYWVLSSYWATGCLAVGLWILELIAPRQYRIGEKAFVAFPLGVLAFAMATVAASLLASFGRAFFFLAPAAFIALGLVELRQFVRALWARRGAGPSGLTYVDFAALAFGAVGLLLVYVPILTPHNLQHDARWYHLPIAAQYVAEGRIPRFPEGWFLGAYPHLSSLLYAWALLLPRGIVHRIELSAHLEFVIFLVTVASIPALVRRLVPGMRVPVAWAGFFLFPGFLVYDATVSLGADHVAALWAPAGLLALLATLRTGSPRHAALVGALAAGAAWTKYSALSVALPLLGAVLIFVAIRARREEAQKHALLTAAAALLTFAVCWSPHWLKNWVFYGDPVYPHAAERFSPRPWNTETAIYVRVFLRNAVLRPSRDLAGVWESLRAVLTLGFDVRDYDFHRGLPTFGFLFAATSYMLPFVRPGRRVVLSYALGLAAAIVWYWTNHRDRYLQACLPWFVASTVAVLSVSWSRGRVGKIATTLLVGSQVAFGAGIFLFPANQMSPEGHALPHLIDEARASLEKRYSDRFSPHAEWGFADYTEIGKRLPARSRVLVHEDRLWLGLDAPVVIDEAGWQGGIRYSSLLTTAEVFDVLTRYQVTHVITGIHHGDGGDHGISANIVFWEFLTRHATHVEQHGKLTLWQMPGQRPEPFAPGDVLVLACNLSRPLGLYAFHDVHRARPTEVIQHFNEATPELVARAEYVVFEEGCEAPLDPGIAASFEELTVRRRVTFFRRRSPAPPENPPE